MNTSTEDTGRSLPVDSEITPTGTTIVSAALLYILIAAAAIVAHMYVPTNLFEALQSGQGNQTISGAAGIAAAVSESSRLWILGGAGGEMVILLSEVILSVFLFIIFARVDQAIAILAMVARLVMTTIHGFNLIFYFAALNFAQQGADTTVGMLIDLHSTGFTIGIAFLVIHMIALGYLMWKSHFIPRWIAVLFLLAGIGYLIDSVGLLFISRYSSTPTPVAVAIALAELIFPFWLLIRGRRRIPDSINCLR